MILSLLFLLAAGPANPMPPSAKADPCAVAGACRHIGDFTLKRPGGGVDTFKADMDVPWIKDGTITLFPGEMIVVRLDLGSGAEPQLVLVRAGRAEGFDIEAAAQEMQAGADPDKEVVSAVTKKPATPPLEEGVIRFSLQQSSTTGHMVLLVEDTTGNTLDYKATMIRSGQEEPESTTVCDVPGHRLGLEDWPYPIALMQLSQLRYLDPAPPMKCD